MSTVDIRPVHRRFVLVIVLPMSFLMEGAVIAGC